MTPRLPVRILYGLVVLFFIYCIAVQYNDPDPFVWMAAYGVTAGITCMAFFGVYTLVTPVLAMGYLVAFYVHIPVIDGPWIEIEEAREAGGLLICGLWLLVLGVVGLVNRRLRT